jgi:hypothetical protein
MAWGVGRGFGVEFVFAVLDMVVGGGARDAQATGGVFDGKALGDVKHGLFFARGE